MRRVVISAVLVAFAAGCSSSGDVMLNGTVWTASEVNGRVVDGAEVTAIFDDGRMSGTSGCNRYGADYETSGSDFALTGPIMSTLMACEEPVMDLEQRYLRALESVSRLAQDNSTLNLMDEDSETLVSFTAVSQELAHTSWEIMSYADTSGSVSTLPGTETSVSFDAQALTANAGCNTMSAEYEAAEGELTVSDVAATEMFCDEPPGVMDQEQGVADALRAAQKYRIEGRTLTIWDEDGRLVLDLARN